jgi:hypothetical protein
MIRVGVTFIKVDLLSSIKTDDFLKIRGDFQDTDVSLTVRITFCLFASGLYMTGAKEDAMHVMQSVRCTNF